MKKNIYLRPNVIVFFMETENLMKISDTKGNTEDVPGTGGGGSGGDDADAKQNNWFDWDDEPSSDE